ncbi:MAG: TatD family hydrolase [Verrucomicrobiales bacterium]|nr:TatD family hydrolase [Verrucomicrobiales bacterium]
MIDSHLHLQDCIGAENPDGMVGKLRQIGVTQLMVNSTSPSDWRQVKCLALKYPEVIPSFGVHPWKVESLAPGWLGDLESLLVEFPDACVGEIGLDKWIANHDLPLQKEILSEQLALAFRRDRPVTFHCLQAWGSLLSCYDESPYRGSFLLHSYGGPGEMIDDWVTRGAYFSISGYFFREEKKAKLSVFESIPRERILLETDAPDMALEESLVRYRGDGIGNHPANIEVVYEAFAQWAGEPLPRIREMVRENFQRFLKGIQDEAA